MTSNRFMEVRGIRELYTCSNCTDTVDGVKRNNLGRSNESITS